MGYFRDADEVYATLGKLFEDVANDDELAPKFRRANTIVRYQYAEPESAIGLARAPLSVTARPAAQEPPHRERRQPGRAPAARACDNGPGIPPALLPGVFERFTRADTSGSRTDARAGESGLGLAIAHALVKAQGGNIHAQSAEGKGTTITFWLPRGVNVS